MVKEGRTIDLDIFIGDTDWGTSLTRVLSGNITGASTISREAFLAQPDEEASIHAVQQTINFTTIYDGGETDILDMHTAATDEPYCAVIETDPDLMSFEIARMGLNHLPRNQPPADAITRSMTLPEADRRYFGTGAGSVTPFTFSDSNNSDPVGDLTTDDELFLIITHTDLASFDISVAGASRTYTSVGAHKLAALASNVASASVDVSTSIGADQSLTGFVLVGEAQELPNG